MTPDKSDRVLYAHAVATVRDDELNAFIVVLAEERDGSGDGVELQIALSFDEQDVSLGMDTHCLVLESGATQYGCIRLCTLDGSTLIFDLHAASAAKLGISEQLTVELEVDVDALQRVVRGIVTLFGLDPRPPLLLGFSSPT